MNGISGLDELIVEYLDKKKDVYSIFKVGVDTRDNELYAINNLFEFYPTHSVLNELFRHGRAIWLNSKGDIYYKLFQHDTIHTTSLHKLNILLANITRDSICLHTKHKYVSTKNKRIPAQEPIPIKEISWNTNNSNSEVSNKFNSPTSKNYNISLADLQIVANEEFAPNIPKEFYSNHSNNHLYRNTFIPSYYMLNQPKYYQQFNTSIILQYIYFLANYDKNRFEYIINWLASFFKNLRLRSNVSLVLCGDKNSGKEILFNEIIKPLFGEQYCLKITDDVLQSYSISKLARNKLFYNIDNVSNTILEDRKTKKFISSLISNNEIETYEKSDYIETITKFGQTLITIDEPYIPFVDNQFNQYSIFKINGDINNIHISQWMQTELPSRMSKFILITKIQQDLANFALILKSYSINYDLHNTVFQNDDKNCMQSNLDDKLKAFHNAILEKSSLYFERILHKNGLLHKELIKDLEYNKIKQRNIFKCFEILYPEERILSSRILMTKLRRLDKSFYKTESLQIGTAGLKYFSIT